MLNGWLSSWLHWKSKRSYPSSPSLYTPTSKFRIALLRQWSFSANKVVIKCVILFTLDLPIYLLNIESLLLISEFPFKMYILRWAAYSFFLRTLFILVHKENYKFELIQHHNKLITWSLIHMRGIAHLEVQAYLDNKKIEISDFLVLCGNSFLYCVNFSSFLTGQYHNN